MYYSCHESEKQYIKEIRIEYRNVKGYMYIFKRSANDDSIQHGTDGITCMLCLSSKISALIHFNF